MVGFGLLAGGCWLVNPALALEPGVGSSPTVASLNDSLQSDVYIIGPGDVLELNLFDAPELSGALDVLNDGSVSLPLVGSVVLSGLTLSRPARGRENCCRISCCGRSCSSKCCVPARSACRLWVLWSDQACIPSQQPNPRRLRVVQARHFPACPPWWMRFKSRGDHPASESACGAVAAPSAWDAGAAQAGACQLARSGDGGRPAAEPLPA